MPPNSPSSGWRRTRLLPPVNGGAHRQASVLAGLEALAPQKPKLVLIHDAARPLVDDAVIDGVLDALGQAALPAIPVTDTIKRSDDGAHVLRTEDRRRLSRRRRRRALPMTPSLRRIDGRPARPVNSPTTPRSPSGTGFQRP